mmetsp:Transcript_9261/g.12739  ORF Transcript_9261/g.12739 Transcript_9261/m.12739 type:complete len:472 (-) Transcript_9261:1544-2959(-)
MEQQWLFSPYRERQEHNGIRCKWFAGPLTDIETTEIASGDLLLCIFSLAFVYGWMAFQMRNFFLSTFCMLQVIFSLPLAIVVYRSVFQVPYFQFIHILVIFLVLGIGADDVFVMYDGWRFSLDAPEIQEMIENEEDEDDILEKRMEISFTSTVGSIFTTSFTTIVSFLATSVSPVMPIGSFGILAATAILLNFILVISLVPAILVTNHVWFEKKRCCCYGMYKMILNEEDEDKPSVLGDTMQDKRHIEMKEQKDSTLGVKKASVVDGNRKGSTSNLKILSTTQVSIAMGQIHDDTNHEEKNANEDGKVTEENNEESQQVLDMLVTKVYVPAMRQQYKGYHWVAVIMFVFFLIYGITSFAYGTQLALPDESTEFLPSDNMLVEVPDELVDNYIPGELSSFVELRYPFGIDDFDRGSFNVYDPSKDRGNVEFSNGFDFFPVNFYPFLFSLYLFDLFLFCRPRNFTFILNNYIY